MKKKILYISIGILLVLVFANTSNNTYKKDNKIDDNKAIAIYIEGDNGKYNKTTNIPLKNSGYSFSSKSMCSGSATVNWNNEAWGLELSNIDRENTKCYLYFEKN